MYFDRLIQDFAERVEEIRNSQSEVQTELLYTERQLDRFIDNMDSVNKMLKQMTLEKAALRSKSAEEKPPMLEEDFIKRLEKLLQGSLEHLENRLSERMMNMLKELKEISGPVREAKIREFKEAVDTDIADLSKLFLYDKVESNIEDIGIEEKESRGIDKSLEKLREMRGEGEPGESSKNQEQDKEDSNDI